MFLPLYGSSGPSPRKADLTCNSLRSRATICFVTSVFWWGKKSLIFSLFNFFSYCKDRSDDFRALHILKLKLEIWWRLSLFSISFRGWFLCVTESGSSVFKYSSHFSTSPLYLSNRRTPPSIIKYTFFMSHYDVIYDTYVIVRITVSN